MTHLTCKSVIYSLMIVAVAMNFSVAEIAAQTKSKFETISGEVVSVTKKGRSTVLRVKNDKGEEKDFNLTPKVQFEVKAKGGQDMLADGFFISGLATMPNDSAVAESILVYPDLKGRPPIGKFVKSPKRIGQSQNAYDFSGVVSGREPDAQFEGFEKLTFVLAGKKTARVLVNKATRVEVRLTDTSNVEPGAKVEMTGIPLRGGNVNLVSVVVNSDKEVKPEDFKPEDK